MNTTLNQIRENSPCTDGWQKLLVHLGKTQADDEPLSIITVLDSNGLADALWCLRAVEGYDREIRLYTVWCARQVQHLMTDKRSFDALAVAERYANGLATEYELDIARDAAKDAAKDAQWDAQWDAAYSAARHAQWAAAYSAARHAAYSAAYSAVGAAARDAQAKRLREVCAEIDAAITQQN
jgi:hypothetical protein